MAEKLTFDTPTAVHNYLVNMGYKMGKSKLNSKLSKDLKSIPRMDGVWTKEQIDKYAFSNFKKMNGADISANFSDMAEQLQQEKLKTEKAKRIKAERENEIADGLWILLQEAEQRHTLKVQIFKSALENLVYSFMPELVSLAKGDNEMIPDCQEMLLKAVRKKLNEYARPCKYEVPTAISTKEEDLEDTHASVN